MLALDRAAALECLRIDASGLHVEWRRSREILAALRRARGYEGRKLRDLHFDALIALTARAVGAAVVTCNGDDFLDIRRYEPFELEVWKPLAH